MLLSADFSSPDIAGWQSPLLSQSDTQPFWAVEQGALVQRGDTTLNTPNEEAYFLNGAATWNGVVFEADALATSGEGVGLVWNASGDSFYRVQLFPNLPNAAPKARARTGAARRGDQARRGPGRRVCRATTPAPGRRCA